MSTLTRLQGFTLPLTAPASAGATVPALDVPAPAEREEPRTSGGEGRATLGRKLELTWEALHAAGVAGCPLCGNRMERRASSGRCGCCGSRLS
jgi:hypothetical protein